MSILICFMVLLVPLVSTICTNQTKTYFSNNCSLSYSKCQLSADESSSSQYSYQFINCFLTRCVLTQSTNSYQSISQGALQSQLRVQSTPCQYEQYVEPIFQICVSKCCNTKVAINTSQSLQIYCPAIVPTLALAETSDPKPPLVLILVVVIPITAFVIFCILIFCCCCKDQCHICQCIYRNSVRLRECFSGCYSGLIRCFGRICIARSQKQSSNSTTDTHQSQGNIGGTLQSYPKEKI